MSDLGSLSECLVDNDPAARVRARRLRSKALALSLALEAAILAALLLWPLISPGVLTAHYIVTPAPPYSGWRRSAPSLSNALHSSTSNRLFRRFASPFALRWFVRRRQKIVRRRRTLAWTRAAEAKDRACQAQGQVCPGGTGDRVIVPEPPHAEPPHVRPMQ